jgi:hypothetical protein
MTMSVFHDMQIVNLVSNDVRRFDDAMPFWPFLYAGPLELGIILVLLSYQLGAPAAFAGVATMLLVIPTQVGRAASAAWPTPGMVRQAGSQIHAERHVQERSSWL